MRLFIGLELPGPCRAALGQLDPKLKGLRWLPAEQMHLTLSFLGEVGAASLEPLCEQLAQVQVPPFFLPLEGAGVFNGRSLTVWAGVGRGHPHLFALHKRIQDAVLKAGLEPDLRPFHPHVTVARSKELSPQALRPFLKRHAQTEHGLFHVNRFVLYSSQLGPEGSRYLVEFTQTL